MRISYQRASGWFFWLCAAVAFLYRIAYAAAFPHVFCHPDSPTYFHTAALWAQTGRFEIHFLRTPAYPVFLLGLESLSLVPLLAVIQHVTLVLCIVFLGWLLCRMYPGTGARVLAGLFVLFCGFAPSQFLYASAMLTEGVQAQVLALLLAGFWFWEIKPGASRLALFSLLIALALLLRPANAVLGIAAALAIAAKTKKKAARPLAMFLALVLAFVSPWLAYNKVHHGRLALANMSAMPLAHSFGHLLAMDTTAHQAEKDVIRPQIEAYARMRQGLPLQDLLFAGQELAWGEASLQAVIQRAFSLTPAQAESRVRDLVLEGVAAHPREAARLVLERFKALYGRTPVQVDRLYARFVDAPEQGCPDFSGWDADAKGLEGRGVSVAPESEQRRRQTRAGAFIPLAKALAKPFSTASLWLFWASMALFPFVLFSRRAVTGLFVFLCIHGNMALVALAVPPEPRYLQPFMILTWFLVCMEVLSVPVFVKALRRKGEAHEKTRP